MPFFTASSAKNLNIFTPSVGVAPRNTDNMTGTAPAIAPTTRQMPPSFLIDIAAIFKLLCFFKLVNPKSKISHTGLKQIDITIKTYNINNPAYLMEYST
jgi:hypothetical protein